MKSTLIKSECLLCGDTQQGWASCSSILCFLCSCTHANPSREEVTGDELSSRPTEMSLPDVASTYLPTLVKFGAVGAVSYACYHLGQRSQKSQMSETLREEVALRKRVQEAAEITRLLHERTLQNQRK
jgi:hypothetical protein